MIEILYTSALAAAHYGDTGSGPQYATRGAAAFDLRAIIDSAILLKPGEQAMVPTGLKLNMGTYLDDRPGNFDHVTLAAIALPRSGRGSKEGLILANTVGLCDADYLGEIMLCCWARPQTGKIISFEMAGDGVQIQPGERIAQLAFVPIIRPQFNVVTAFSHCTERGAGGFGSTGHA